MESTPESREKVRSELPEIDSIADIRLREAVVEIWAHAWQTSDWNRLTDCPKGFDLPREHTLVTHSRNVAIIGMTMADVIAQNNSVPVRKDDVIAIALLHDVSKLLEFEEGPDSSRKSEIGHKYQHGFLGAAWMREAGLSVDLVHAVIAHTPLSGVVPQTQEAVIVHYADFADTDSLLLKTGRTLFCKRK